MTATVTHKLLFTGGYKLHLDYLINPHNKQFLSLLDVANLKHHVSFLTHFGKHILDIVITLSLLTIVMLTLVSN
jgi:hypothetical protein